jgi:hypothetical protein
MSRRHVTTVLWLAAFALAAGGGIAYLISPGDWMWYLGSAATIPLVILVVRRAERVERKTGQSRSAWRWV